MRLVKRQRACWGFFGKARRVEKEKIPRSSRWGLVTEMGESEVSITERCQMTETGITS